MLVADGYIHCYIQQVTVAIPSLPPSGPTHGIPCRPSVPKRSQRTHISAVTLCTPVDWRAGKGTCKNGAAELANMRHWIWVIRRYWRNDRRTNGEEKNNDDDPGLMHALTQPVYRLARAREVGVCIQRRPWLQRLLQQRPAGGMRYSYDHRRERTLRNAAADLAFYQVRVCQFKSNLYAQSWDYACIYVLQVKAVCCITLPLGWSLLQIIIIMCRTH